MMNGGLGGSGQDDHNDDFATQKAALESEHLEVKRSRNRQNSMKYNKRNTQTKQTNERG
jgi:hypothetical protein